MGPRDFAARAGCEKGSDDGLQPTAGHATDRGGEAKPSPGAPEGKASGWCAAWERGSAPRERRWARLIGGPLGEGVGVVPP